MTAEMMWAQFAALHPSAAAANHEAWAYGGAPDELAMLTLRGIKTATSSAFALYEPGGEPLPQAGEEYSVILNSRDEAVCITRTTRVYVCPFDQVSEKHAWREGEGDRSLACWRQVHEAFFRKEMAAAGLPFDPAMPIVCEEFEVVYP